MSLGKSTVAILLGITVLAASWVASELAVRSHRIVSDNPDVERVVKLRIPGRGPEICDLRTLTAGSRIAVPCMIQNDSPEEVRLGPFRTSCDCLSVRMSCEVVRPGEFGPGVIVIDMGKDPNFLGRLALSVEATISGSAGSSSTLSAVVMADVR